MGISQNSHQRIAQVLGCPELRGGIMDLRAEWLEKVLHGAWDHGLCGRRELLDLAKAPAAVGLNQIVGLLQNPEVWLMLRDRDAALGEIPLEQQVSIGATTHAIQGSAIGATRRTPQTPVITMCGVVCAKRTHCTHDADERGDRHRGARRAHRSTGRRWSSE